MKKVIKRVKIVQNDKFGALVLALGPRPKDPVRGNCRVFHTYLQTHFWPKQVGCFATPLARNFFCFLYSILVLHPSTYFTHPFLLFVFFKIGMLRHLLVGQSCILSFQDLNVTPPIGGSVF